MSPLQPVPDGNRTPDQDSLLPSASDGFRVATNIACTVSTHDGLHKGIIVVVTATGFDIITLTFVPLESDSRLVVMDGPLQGFGGRIRWAANTRQVVELDPEHHGSATLLNLVGTLARQR